MCAEDINLSSAHNLKLIGEINQMLKIYNATRHKQLPLKDEWEKYGITFVPTFGPQISSIHPRASTNDLNFEADEAIEKAVNSGADGILIGGISGLSCLVAIKAIKHNLKVIEPMFNGRSDFSYKIFSGFRDLTNSLKECINL